MKFESAIVPGLVRRPCILSFCIANPHSRTKVMHALCAWELFTQRGFYSKPSILPDNNLDVEWPLSFSSIENAVEVLWVFFSLSSCTAVLFPTTISRFCC